MKKLVSVGALMLVVLMGVICVGCNNDNSLSKSVIDVELIQTAIENGKVYTTDDFQELNLDIEVMHTVGSTFLTIVLKDPSNNNANSAVKKLKKRDDVKFVGRANLSESPRE